MSSFELLAKQRRVETANEFINVIASCGRNFLSENSDRQTKIESPFISFMEIDKTGKIWFTDYYTKKRIYTQYNGRWNGFTSGGTMQSIVKCLRNYIRDGKKMRAGYFNKNEGEAFGNPWGYKDDILIVKEAAVRLGIAA